MRQEEGRVQRGLVSRVLVHVVFSPWALGTRHSLPGRHGNGEGKEQGWWEVGGADCSGRMEVVPREGPGE